MEILIILFVIFSVALIFRMFRGDKTLAAQGKKELMDVSSQELPANRSQFKLAGILIVVFGIAALLLGGSLFKIVYKFYFWAIMLVGMGIVVLVFTRRR